MQVLEARMERAGALSKGGRHAEALADTAAMRLLAPPKAADRRHFESTLMLEESKLLGCAGNEVWRRSDWPRLSTRARGWATRE